MYVIEKLLLCVREKLLLCVEVWAEPHKCINYVSWHCFACVAPSIFPVNFFHQDGEYTWHYGGDSKTTSRRYGRWRYKDGNSCYELILVPRGAVRMCKWRRSNYGWLHWRNQGVSNLYEPVSFTVFRLWQF